MRPNIQKPLICSQCKKPIVGIFYNVWGLAVCESCCKKGWTILNPNAKGILLTDDPET